jgi:hypothetical protein
MALAYVSSKSQFQIVKIWEGTLDLTAAPYATAAMAEQDVTVTGILSTDIVLSFYATDQVTFGIGNCRVKADNTISVVPVATDTDTAVDPAGTINYRLITLSVS